MTSLFRHLLMLIVTVLLPAIIVAAMVDALVPGGVWLAALAAATAAAAARLGTEALLRRPGAAPADHAATLERELAERTAALQDRERRCRGIFDSAFHFLALLTCEGVVLELNRAALAFYGVAESEAVGRRLWEVAPWADSPPAVAGFRLRLAQAAAGESVRFETARPDRSGRTVPFDLSLRPIFDAGGGVAMLVVEARDISERAELQAKLVQAQKMEAVGQLTGGVAHDFNNLLQALVGNLDLIRRLGESSGDARLLHLVTNAQRAAARGTRLTRQMLAFSRQHKLRIESVSIDRLTAEMADLLRRAAGETIRLEMPLAPDLWACELELDAVRDDAAQPRHQRP